MDRFYPEGVKEFREMMDKWDINLPRDLVKNLSEEQIETMIAVSLAMDPLWENCLGKDWKSIMTRDKARSLFLKM